MHPISTTIVDAKYPNAENGARWMSNITESRVALPPVNHPRSRRGGPNITAAQIHIEVTSEVAKQEYNTLRPASGSSLFGSSPLI